MLTRRSDKKYPCFQGFLSYQNWDNDVTQWELFCVSGGPRFNPARCNLFCFFFCFGFPFPFFLKKCSASSWTTLYTYNFVFGNAALHFLFSS